MSKEKRFVIQVDPLEIEDDAIFDNKELRLYECQSDMMSDICGLLNKQDQQIADLEAKLAESEIFKKGAYKEINKLHKRINEIVKRDKNIIETLHQQLAEKDKEIENLKHCNDRLAQGIYHSYGEHFILKVKQNKIDFAVEQLEKVKERYPRKTTMWSSDKTGDGFEYVSDFIDNLIKEIKGE